MRAFASISLLSIGLVVTSPAQDTMRQAHQLEAGGDPMGARTALVRAVRSAPNEPNIRRAYAEFLDRYGDPETRTNYEKLFSILEKSPDSRARAAVARRLVVLDLIEGDQDGAVRHLGQYRAAGGADWDGSALPRQKEPDPATRFTLEIPGPLRGFARMAALAPDMPPAELMPALARNVVMNGYQAGTGAESLDPTEYMKLVNRYLSQARELAKLAGPENTIRIPACDSPQTGELLRILGYRMRGGCGSDVVLETVNATRAFLTIDSGFPLAELEQSLRINRPFTFEYKSTQVPILYGVDYWLSAKEKQGGEAIDAFLGDPSLCRLYLGMSKLDRQTADELREAVPIQRLRPFAHVLDFFGNMFQIREGKAIVPGGSRTAQTWAELTGVSPDKGTAFFEKLITRDDGWMASYFDVLARINGPVRDYLLEPARLKRFYMALRGRVTSPGPARPVFRSNAELMLLTTRLRLEPDGRPHVPGSIEVWKNLFITHPNGKYDGKLTKSASTWKEPDDVVEALFALCRKAVDNQPLKMFMALSDLNRNRPKPLDPPTVERLTREYRTMAPQLPVLSECPSISDATIGQFMDTAQVVNKISDVQLRANVAGTVQALIGLWQIFCRQGAIADSDADGTLSGILTSFAKVRNSRELFDVGRNGVDLLLKATSSSGSGAPQDRMMNLLAGLTQPSDSDAQTQVLQEMVRIFEAQRLVSLDTLFNLADNLESMSRGEKPNVALLNRLASRIAEIQLPRANMSMVEKNALAFGYWTERHIETQRKVNLRALIEKSSNDPEKLKEARGLLAPFLRDTLVGFNYIHYAPPGAQVLLTNPLFVRSHDFIGIPGAAQTWRYTEVMATGWPVSAGGRLIGSLSGLPYALAEAEQNFMVPAREQALIWGDLAPQMIVSATVPRWWNVAPAQMHWVELHMRYGESLIAEAALDSKRRQQVAEILGRQAVPARQSKVTRLLEQGDVRGALDSVTPEEIFVLASDAVEKDKSAASPFATEIRRLSQEYPDKVNEHIISRTFGSPKPTLTNSYRPELLFLRTFPTLMGYSSRVMAETWESNSLYWASLADQVHLQPAQLNVLIPEWTRQTVEKIFATHLEDWPAVLRSLRTVGDDVRLKIRMQMDTDQKASLQ
jgi:hypothetical protein